MTNISPGRQERIRETLTYFSVIVYFTGIMLFLLCAKMIYKYLTLDNSADTPRWFFYIVQTHGFDYMAFFIVIVSLGTKARWGSTRWIITALGDVVPFLSFFVEEKCREKVETTFQLR